MPNGKNYYQILQVDPSAEPEVINAAYKRLSIKYHPDTNRSDNANQRMQEINEAYQVLKDPTRRAHYDLYYIRNTHQKGGNGHEWNEYAPPTGSNPGQASPPSTGLPALPFIPQPEYHRYPGGHPHCRGDSLQDLGPDPALLPFTAINPFSIHSGPFVAPDYVLRGSLSPAAGLLLRLAANIDPEIWQHPAMEQKYQSGCCKSSSEDKYRAADIVH
jgi:hypothetical protein